MRSLPKKPQKKILHLIDTCFERSVTVSHRQFTSLVKCRPLLSFCSIPFLDFNKTMKLLFHCPCSILRCWTKQFTYIHSSTLLKVWVSTAAVQNWFLIFFFLPFSGIVIELCRDYYTLQLVVPFPTFGSKVSWLCISHYSTCLAYDHIPLCISKPHLRNENSLRSSTMCFLPGIQKAQV